MDSNIQIDELIKLLNNRNYCDEITPEIKEFATKNNLVIVYGASDDLMEFTGAIHEEVDCYGGGEAHLIGKELATNLCDDPLCPYYKKNFLDAIEIKAIWGEGGYSWTYETKIPHKTFDIIDDDDKYCRGIVFSIEDL